MKRAATAKELTVLHTTLQMGAMCLVTGMETIKRSFSEDDAQAFCMLLCLLKDLQGKCEVQHASAH